MRIGELLLQHRWVEWEALALAIGDQPASGMRMCSFLIERGQLAFDDAARALGEHHGCAAVLQRHFEQRDPALADLLPEEAARRLVALPIGRLENGSLIVAVRDPRRDVLATLTRLLGEKPVLAVAPARYLERLVNDAYAPRELHTDDLEEAADDERVSSATIDIDELIDTEISAPALDDVPIDVELPPAPAAKPPLKSRTISVVVPKLVAVASNAPKRDSLDATLAAFREIDDPDWLFDIAMEHIAKHWASALLLTLNDKRAVGTRGHGTRITPTVVRTCVVEIAEVAILELARTERRIISEPPSELGAEHEVLAMLFDGNRCPIAAPIVRGEVVGHVLLVAEPVGADLEDALADLGMLVEAMGEALTRM